MFRIAASILIVIAVLCAWYLAQESSTPRHEPESDGIHLGQ